MNGAPSVGLANPVDPRAVIIKNIPFHLSRPAMLEMINKMDMPKPYAMNYLFDNGMFHGLAFANFETEEETKIAIEKLNGLDVMGRKLVVQAKQVQSSQSQPFQQHQGHRSQQGGYPPFLPQQSRRGPFNNDNSMYRHYHNEIQAFLGNPALEELNFPTSLSNEERKVIHIVAEKLGIQHVSLGEGKERFVKVTKQPLPVKQPPVVRKEPPTRPVFKLKQAISNESISAVVPCRQPYGPDPKPENNFKQRIGSRKLNVNAAEFIVEST
ncbi:hypothetical protein BKA69DRAFT_1043256 [Paraphysoderma sedebokerense]|nr:hypothetical protein BKA69DRAFT_1096774 [Paraphysoderma sedebokerense]KAI9146157.1 hypothetical protein BKA69DRAFT_1043256 [Paraphysoderma sedebokerense]